MMEIPDRFSLAWYPGRGSRQVVCVLRLPDAVLVAAGLASTQPMEDVIRDVDKGPDELRQLAECCQYRFDDLYRFARSL